jgi:hypothetical protein
MKRIRYAEVTLKVTIPVYTHTNEEAQAVALDQLGDFVSSFEPADWERVRCGPPELFLGRPDHVPNDALVWGDGVPEDHCTVEALTLHIEQR